MKRKDEMTDADWADLRFAQGHDGDPMVEMLTLWEDDLRAQDPVGFALGMARFRLEQYPTDSYYANACDDDFDAWADLFVTREPVRARTGRRVIRATILTGLVAGSVLGWAWCAHQADARQGHALEQEVTVTP